MYTDAVPAGSVNDEDYGQKIVVDGVDFAAIYRAIEHSYEVTEWARNLYKNLINLHNGPGYGGMRGEDVPLNKMFQYVETYLMLLTSSNPQANVSTIYRELKAFANLFKDTVNDLGKEIEISDTFAAGIQDAFFLMGVAKVHRDSWEEQQFKASEDSEEVVEMDPGIPTASIIQPEDFAFDLATTVKRMKWATDKFRVPFSTIRKGIDDGMYDPLIAAQLHPNKKQGTEKSRVDQMGASQTTDDDEIEEMIDLCTVWVAKTKRIYFCAIEDPSKFSCKKTRPLGSIPWRYRKSSPYHLLRFSRVPHNIIPLSPAHLISSMHQALNANMNKEIQSVGAAKENLVYRPEGEQTAAAVVNAPNLKPVAGDPDHMKIFRSGGLDQNHHQALLSWMEMIDMMAGNLTSLAGLGASSRTVGQDQIIAQAANKKVGSLQSQVVEWMTGIYKNLGFLLYEDSFREFVQPVEVAGFKSTDKWEPYKRAGDFFQYNFDLGTYALNDNPPAMQAELLMGVLERIFIPSMEMLMAQGGQVDFAALAAELADLYDMPVLDEILKFATPALGDDQEKPSFSLKGRKPPSTNRNVNYNGAEANTNPMQRLQQMATSMTPAANTGVPTI